MQFRAHGPELEPSVVVLHGGPGAPGSAGGLAHLLAERRRVLEPFQRDESRTVAAHVADLRAFCHEHCPRPVLVGHSWGAMLALAYAVEHPVRGLVLVCSGTFDLAARAVFKRIVAAVDAVPPGERAAAIDRLYTVDPLPDDPLDATDLDARGNRDTWDDMVRLQAEGRYPAAFVAIAAPVLMVHGADDPHPGGMIRDSLRPYLPQLEYRELPRCGHYPWRERHARNVFGRTVLTWLDAV